MNTIHCSQDPLLIIVTLGHLHSSDLYYLYVALVNAFIISIAFSYAWDNLYVLY